MKSESQLVIVADSSKSRPPCTSPLLQPQFVFPNTSQYILGIIAAILSPSILQIISTGDVVAG